MIDGCADVCSVVGDFFSHLLHCIQLSCTSIAGAIGIEVYKDERKKIVDAGKIKTETYAESYLSKEERERLNSGGDRKSK